MTYRNVIVKFREDCDTETLLRSLYQPTFQDLIKNIKSEAANLRLGTTNNLSVPFLKPVEFSQKEFGITLRTEDYERLLSMGVIERADENIAFKIPYGNEIGPAASVAPDPNWGIDFLHVRELHELGFKGQGVKLAILDTGIDIKHPCFQKTNLKEFKSFSSEGIVSSPIPFDSQWHGSHVSGIAVGWEESGTNRGIAYDCDLYIGQVIHNQTGYVASIKQGLRWLIDQVKPNVVNLSIEWAGIHGDWISEILELTRLPAIVCIASGNGYTTNDKTSSPGNYTGSNLFSVGAIDQNVNIWKGSGGGTINWAIGTLLEGQQALIPTLVAPGVEIISAASGDMYRLESGTSMACPHISGLATALLSIPGQNVNTVSELLFHSITDLPPLGFDERFGQGVINVNKIFSQLGIV